VRKTGGPANAYHSTPPRRQVNAIFQHPPFFASAFTSPYAARPTGDKTPNRRCWLDTYRARRGRSCVDVWDARDEMDVVEDGACRRWVYPYTHGDMSAGRTAVSHGGVPCSAFMPRAVAHFVSDIGSGEGYLKL
jgi:hypothetical protein